MNRGSLYAIEVLLVFLGWMMVLALVWNQTGTKTNEAVSEWNMQRMKENAWAQSDALMLKHHIDPWQGCAHYDESLRRSLPYVVEETCLEKLSFTQPIHGIFEVAIEQREKRTIFFHTENENEDCVIIGRPIILFPEETLAILEVKACEE